MMKVAAYCRVSTDKQDQANSFESQKRYFREYIERNDKGTGLLTQFVVSITPSDCVKTNRAN